MMGLEKLKKMCVMDIEQCNTFREAVLVLEYYLRRAIRGDSRRLRAKERVRIYKDVSYTQLLKKEHIK